MAIKINDYTQTKEKNIKLYKKDKKQFLFDFRIDGKRYRKIFKIKNDVQSYVEDLKDAKVKLEVLKSEIKMAKQVSVKQDTDAVTISSKAELQTSARELFKKVYAGINECYAQEAIIKAFFFFAFAGRSKDEIRSIKWENINLETDYYWIENNYNDEKKEYPLPAMVKAVLFEIHQDREGFVFQGIGDDSVLDIARPMQQLKEYVHMESLTLESMRTILVNALKEEANG